jgi:hypothetical protein
MRHSLRSLRQYAATLFDTEYGSSGSTSTSAYPHNELHLLQICLLSQHQQLSLYPHNQVHLLQLMLTSGKPWNYPGRKLKRKLNVAVYSSPP